LTIEESIDSAVQRALDRHMGGLREELAELKRALPPRFVTIAQAAEALGCHKNTVRRMVKAGQLKYKHVGVGRNGIRIDASSLHGAGGDEVPELRAARGGR
jgi:excisionase family DNA binding protein